MTDRRPPKRMTEARLKRIIGHYLERYTTTSSHLRRLMLRRVHRAAAHHGEDPGEATGWLDDEILRLQRVGVLDDALYAADRARALARRGNGPRQIRAKLGAKGLGAAHIDAALEALAADGRDPEWEAARTYARKRRMGPWAAGAVDPDTFRKHLARMARQGFGYDVARRALETPLDDEG